MPRAWVWLQLALGWLPVWALYTTLILTSHPGSTFRMAALRGAWAIGVAAVLGVGVWRLTERLPWPHPFRWRFALGHVGLAALYAGLFAAFTFGLDTHLQALDLVPVSSDGVILRHVVVIGGGWLTRFLVLGVWLYVMVAGVAYANRGTERAARAEALAAGAQLATLRAQLNPHFLFNALHTVVHLIPKEPAQASEAAEQLAGLLRTTLEEDRDLVPLAEEWAFVERYLAVERIRFGDRLRLRLDLAPDTLDLSLPAFAVQTLVENAVRHGVGPNVDPTDLAVDSRLRDGRLVVTVHDTGPGASPAAVARSTGTGLARLRERLAVLYGNQASLSIGTGDGAGFTVTLAVPPDQG